MIADGFCLMIFCDLVGSSEVANELTPQHYANDYIKSFYFVGESALNFIEKEIDCEWKLNNTSKIEYDPSGDEILIFKKIEDIKDCTNDVVTALSFAYTLKLYWLLSPYTVKKILDKKPPREIACGVHIGRIVRVKSSNLSDNSTKYASYDINIAKRVEGVSRKGTSSNVYVTNFIGEKFNKWRKKELQERKLITHLRLLTCTGFESVTPEPLTGIAEKVWVSELIPNFKHPDNKISLSDILDAMKDETSGFKAYETLSSCIKIFFGQQNQDNRWFSKESSFKGNEAEIINKYLENLIYLSKCSANLWFNFNAFYIASALVSYTKMKALKIADISEDITEICNDLKDSIKKSIKKED